MIKYGLVLFAIAAAAFITVGIGSAIRFGAATAQDQPCVKALSSPHFDLLATVDIPADSYTSWDGEGPEPRTIIETKISVSGGDYHLVADFSDGSERIENIFVNGEGYQRYGEGDWEDTKAVTGVVIHNLLGLGKFSEGNIVCPDLTNAVKGGEETVNGVSMTRYQLTSSVDLAKLIPGKGVPPQIVTHTWDYWIDSTSQLVQVKHVHTYPPSDGQSRRVIKEVTQILGIGEVNTITVPNVGP